MPKPLFTTFNYSNTTCCCKNCAKRAVGCHSNCAEYAEYKRQLSVIKQKERNEKLGSYVEPWEKGSTTERAFRNGKK